MKRLLVPVVLLMVACREQPLPGPVASPASAASTATIDAAAPSRADGGDGAAPAQGALTDSRFAFVTRAPRTVGELEAALALHLADPPEPAARMGSLLIPSGKDRKAPASSEIERVSVDYRWDRYHQAPVATVDALRRRDLVRYSVRFVRGRADCEAELRAAHGEPRARAKPERPRATPHRQYGPFAVDASDGDAFTLEWYAQPPDWFADPVDDAARLAALAELARALPSAKGTGEIGPLAARWPRSAGIVAKGSLNAGDFWLELVPAMAAREVAQAFAMKSAVAESVGVHQSQWRLVETTGPRAWAAKRIGPWTLEPSLTEAPSGESIPHAPPGPTSRRALTPTDAVRSLRLVHTP